MIRMKCELVGTIEGGGYEKRLEENRRVYSPQGISPTVTTRGNSGYEVKIVENKCKLVGTVEGGGYEKMFEESRRVYSPDGISPTVVTKKGGNHEVKIATNNKKGYEEVEEGDFLNLQYASSSTRRGRVGKQVAQTICCTDEQGVAVSVPFAYDEQNGIARTDGTVGTLTTDGSSPKHNNRVVVVDDIYKSRDPREYTEYAPCIRAERDGFKVVTKNEEVKRAYVSEKGAKYILSPKRGMATDINPSVSIPITRKGQSNWTGSFISPDIDRIEKSTTIGSTEPTDIYLKNGEKITSDDDTSHLRIRKLTPLECWRLMDFDDEDFYKAKEVESNTQLYA